MAKVSFSVAYDGPALADGSMDVRDLAPALLSMGQLLKGVSKELYGKDYEIKVSVSATGSGSFEILLELSSLWSQFVDIFTGDSVEALNNLLDLVARTGVGGYGLIELFKRIKNRKILKSKELGNGRVEIVMMDENLEIDEELYRIYQSPEVRTAIERIIKHPLDREGITHCKIVHSDKTTSIPEHEAEYFSARSPLKEEVRESSYQEIFKLVSVSFKPDNKWRVSDGTSTISVTIADEQFLEKIEKNVVSFSKEDMLVCDVIKTQTLDDHGDLKSTHVIQRVVEHKHPPDLPQIPNNSDAEFLDRHA